MCKIVGIGMKVNIETRKRDKVIIRLEKRAKEMGRGEKNCHKNRKNSEVTNRVSFEPKITIQNLIKIPLLAK